MPRKSYDDATLVPNHNEPRRMISEKQILDLLPIARSTLQKWERDGLFPKSVKIGDNRKAWYEDEIAAWQKHCEAARAR